MNKALYLILTITLISCLKADDLKKEYAGFSPVNIGDGWFLGTCLSNNIDSVALNNVFRNVYNDESTWPMKSLSVFRNNELIAESYLKDEIDRTKVQAIWSCTKQVMALLAGKLVDDQELFLSDRIEQFIPEYTNLHKDKKDILIRNLLMMHSGIGFHNDDHTDVYRKKEVTSSVDFALGLDLEAAPGSRFNYNDGDPQILSAVIQNITRTKTDQFANEVLFESIGLRNYEWRRYPDGISMGGFGILTTPREIAKIGQLVLNKGMWDSTQVISETWIENMLTEHSTVPGNSQLRFGYYWWINPSKNYYFMWGHGGQYVFLIPEKNAMVVITSLEQIEADHTVWVEEATSIVDQVNKTLK